MAARKSKTKNFSAIVTTGSPDKPLSEQEFKYVQARATGLNKTASARLAGYANPKDCGDVEDRPHVLAALRLEQAAYAQQSSISRQKVIDGIITAIDQAVIAADPMAQIAGWRELAKICGYYAPEVKEVKLSTDAQKLLHKFESMSDEQLLELASGGNVIEGECRVVN